MQWLWLLIELALELLASWTLAVHACMGLGLAAWWAWPLFSVLLGAMLWLSRGRLRSALDAERNEVRFALGVLTLGAVFGGVSLCLLTPSGDDFNFFHRALWQVDHLREPFARGDTAFNASGLAALSPLHVLTTWELGIAMTARLLGLQPLGVYHNGVVFGANLLLAATFALWLREVRFGVTASLAGCLAAFLFFFVDDPELRSFGLAYRTLWVGKALEWALLFPIALLCALRYLRSPSPRALWHPLLCGVCAVALSGTGVFLLPGLLAAASLAGLALGRLELGRFELGHVLRCGLLNVGSLYCFAVAGLVLSGILSQPENQSAWSENFPKSWAENLMLVLGTPLGVVRFALLALVVPMLALEGRGRRFWLGLSIAVALLFANPLAGPLWIEAARPGAFWRVALLIPLPLLVGFAMAAAVDRFASPRRVQALVLAAAVVVLLALTRLSPPPADRAMGQLYALKQPFELRFPPETLHFLRRVAPVLEGRSLLAPPGVAPTAALLVPSLRLEAARLRDTRHVFANAGRPEEGERRLQAWLWTRRCDVWPVGERAVSRSLETGVDALILRDCGEGASATAARRRLLESRPERWREIERSGGLVLWAS